MIHQFVESSPQSSQARKTPHTMRVGLTCISSANLDSTQHVLRLGILNCRCGQKLDLSFYQDYNSYQVCNHALPTPPTVGR